MERGKFITVEGVDGPDGTAKSGAITFLEGARPQIQMF